MKDKPMSPETPVRFKIADEQITHYMPLPAPPSASTQGESK
jgi:hypothetical protein